MRSLPLIAALLAGSTGLDPIMLARLTAAEAELADLQATAVSLRASASTAGEIAAFQLEVDATRTELDGAMANASDLAGVVSTVDDQATTLETRSTTLAADLAALSAEATNVVDHRVWFEVHNEDELFDALDQFHSMRFLSGGEVFIEVQRPGFAVSRPIVIDHPQGKRLQLLGDDNIYRIGEDVRLTFDGTDGIVVAAGTHLDRIDGLILEGGDAGVGIRVDNGASAALGHHVLVSGFQTGITVTNHSSVEVLNGGCGSHLLHGKAMVSNNRGNGVEVTGGSYFSGQRCGFISNDRHGLWVSGNSYADVTNGESRNNIKHGVLVEHDSYVVADGLETLDNDLSGMRVSVRSVAVYEDGQSVGNASDGLTVHHGSVVMHEGSDATDNLRHGVSVSQDSHVMAGSFLTDNGESGLRVELGSTVDATAGRVFGNASDGVWASGNSELRISQYQVPYFDIPERITDSYYWVY